MAFTNQVLELSGVKAVVPLRASISSMDRVDFIKQHGGTGWMFAAALNWGVEASIKPAHDSRYYIIKAGGREERVTDPRQIVHDYVRAAVLFHRLGPVQIDVTASVPAKMGLGGSSAFMMALNIVCSVWKNGKYAIDPQALLLQTAFLEIGPADNGLSLGKSNGVQDEMGSLAINLSGARRSPLISMPIKADYARLFYYQNGSLSTTNWHFTAPQYDRQIIFPPEAAHWFSESMLIFSINPREVGDASGNIESQKSDIQHMRRMAELTRSAAEALAELRLDDFSQAVRESWQMKMQLPGVVPPHTKDFYDKVSALPVRFIRLMGAGGGGCFLVVADDTNLRQHIIELSKQDDSVWYCAGVRLANEDERAGVLQYKPA